MGSDGTMIGSFGFSIFATKRGASPEVEDAPLTPDGPGYRVVEESNVSTFLPKGVPIFSEKMGSSVRTSREYS
jgi:hypothetical protein